MMYGYVAKEIKSLEEITKKTDLTDYYHRCQKKLSPQISQSYSTTQFEFEHYEGKINDLIISFVRDYALFDVDESDLLKGVTSKELDDDLFNCFSRTRMGLD